LEKIENLLKKIQFPDSLPYKFYQHFHPKGMVIVVEVTYF